MGDLKINGLHQSVTLGAAVYSPAVPAGGSGGILVQALAQNIRFTLSNGQAPTTTTGFQILAGDPPFLIPLSSGATPQFIRETSGAIMEYQWMG